MELSRQYLIDRMQSKISSIEEFNYDKLMAPPLYAMLSQQDIDNLRYIATSVKYSGKPKEKYEMMDSIMRPRGFVKLSAGTNRVTYRHLDNNQFVIKVAADAVGMGDNPREFQNQFIFKPFVTKVFEVSPCGTVGVFERVNPITSREEFLSVADDIYEVITNWFIGQYIMADIGTAFFMNWGIRTYNTTRDGSVAFGPVLLDFPYVYELDGNKMFCNCIDKQTNQRCGGVIDYDDGFNFLVCTKCKSRYRVAELAKKIDQKIIKIERNNGGSKMKIARVIDGKLVVPETDGIKPAVAKVNKEKSVSVKVGSLKVMKPGQVKYDKPEEIEKPVEETNSRCYNRGVVSQPVESKEDDVVVETYKALLNAKCDQAEADIVENSEEVKDANEPYVFDSYDAEFDLVFLKGENGDIISTRMDDIVAKSNLNAEIDELNELNDTLKRENEILAKDFAGLEDELKAAEADVNELKTKDSEKSEKISSLIADNEAKDKKVEELDAKVKQLTDLLDKEMAKKNLKGAIPSIINPQFVPVDSKYYGDATVLDAKVDRISGFANPTVDEDRAVLVFQIGDEDDCEYLTDSDGNIIVVGTINGYLIDDLFEDGIKTESEEVKEDTVKESGEDQ